jgi:cell division protein ZipA
MTSPGILVFAKLPSPINGLTLFDHLLETARKLTEKLSGILCDESRQPITEEIIEAMRSRILTHNFSIHSESQNTHVHTE